MAPADTVGVVMVYVPVDMYHLAEPLLLTKVQPPKAVDGIVTTWCIVTSCCSADWRIPYLAVSFQLSYDEMRGKVDDEEVVVPALTHGPPVGISSFESTTPL
jgi:hypothetical protein